ncbi:hypothetical protein D3C78_1647040 [compost metagenome]
MLLHILLQHPSTIMTKTVLSDGPGYLRVLGFNSKGRELLKTMKKTASLPIVTRAAELDHPQLSLDLKASAIYANGMEHRSTSELMMDFRQPPIQFSDLQ